MWIDGFNGMCTYLVSSLRLHGLHSAQDNLEMARSFMQLTMVREIITVMNAFCRRKFLLLRRRTFPVVSTPVPFLSLPIALQQAVPTGGQTTTIAAITQC